MVKEKLTDKLDSENRNRIIFCDFCGAPAIAIAVKIITEKKIPFCKECIPSYTCRSAITRMLPWVDRIVDIYGRIIIP